VVLVTRNRLALADAHRAQDLQVLLVRLLLLQDLDDTRYRFLRDEFRYRVVIIIKQLSQRSLHSRLVNDHRLRQEQLQPLRHVQLYLLVVLRQDLYQHVTQLENLSDLLTLCLPFLRFLLQQSFLGGLK
jgi:hypothetical protein